MTAHERVKPDPDVWLPLLQRYRLTTLPHDMVLEGRLRPELSPSSPDVRNALETGPPAAYLDHHDDVTDIVLVFPVREEGPGRRIWVHLTLLAATLFTTLAAGALMRGRDPFGTRILELGHVALPYPSELRWRSLFLGAPFAFPFLGVLLAHEMGHYFAARHHRVRASLPYFIPMPPYLSVIGTIGAFIRLRGPTVRRAILFDVGAAGPLASFAVSIPVLALGLALSRSVPGQATPLTPFLIRFAGEPIWLGSDVVTHLLASWVGPPGLGRAPILLHPLAVVGWLGLFVTALNLLPLGQLDGGHILYALSPGRQSLVARGFLVFLVPMGLWWWGWWAWAVVITLLHRGRLRHPPVLQSRPEMGAARVALAWAVIAIFLLTFVPVPLKL